MVQIFSELQVLVIFRFKIRSFSGVVSSNIPKNSLLAFVCSGRVAGPRIPVTNQDFETFFSGGSGIAN